MHVDFGYSVVKWIHLNLSKSHQLLHFHIQMKMRVNSESNYDFEFDHS